MNRRSSIVALTALALVISATAGAQMGQRPNPFPGGPMGPGTRPGPGMPGSGSRGPMRPDIASESAMIAPPGSALSHVSYIDTHTHLDGQLPRGGSDWEGAVHAALTAMDGLGIAKSIVMPPPLPANHPNLYDHDSLLAAVRKRSDRFAVVGGGGSLNGMIQDAIATGQTPEAARRRFEERATKIIRDGAVGFGEMTAEHLSFFSRHPYESAPPDHPLFLLLADIAARLDVPIDLHMEAVARDLPLPPRFSSPPNPSALRENISGLERLLAHNPKAKIIWVHAGWDNTGHWTVELIRRLLETHPNLSLSIKVDPLSLLVNRPLAATGALKPEWAELVRAFADRFLIGSDSFYSSPQFPRQRPPSGEGPRAFLDQLPPDVARRVGVDNAARLFNLSK